MDFELLEVATATIGYPSQKASFAHACSVVRSTAVWAQPGYCGRFSLDVVLGIRLLEVQHFEAGQIQDVDWHQANSRK
jgi:hypothetical protein